MTNRTEIAAPRGATPLSRRLTCADCGAEFGCDLSGNCWCAEETAKLPMPTTGDCLCRDCLRKVAAAHAHSQAT